jgi:hypothetical protein
MDEMTEPVEIKTGGEGAPSKPQMSLDMGRVASEKTLSLVGSSVGSMLAHC